MGFLLIALASLSIAVGSYIISCAFEPSSLKVSSIPWGNVKFLCYGIALNLAGSFFWACGRSKFNSYALAWNSYLLLLVVFGTSISYIVRMERFALNQYLGIALGVLAISLISRK